MKNFLYTIGILLLSLVFVWSRAHSYDRTSYNVFTLPVMYLDEGIDEDDTEIVISAPQLNGEEITVLSMSGAIFEFKRPGKKEDIYASRVAVNSDNTLTLTGSIIRNLCQYTEVRTFTSCGAGYSFNRGSQIILPDNHRIFNLKEDLDRLNRKIGSGATICWSPKQPCFAVGRFTTAQRDAFTWNTGSTIIQNTTLGGLQWYDGTSWLSLATATGSFINASENVAGKVEIATDAEILARATTGDTGAAIVIGANSTTILTKSQWATNSGTALTLNADGNIIVTYPYHVILPNSGTSDFIEKILTSGGPGTSTGQIVMLRSSGAQVLNIRSGSGNIQLGRDFTMTNSGFILPLRYDGQNWRSLTELGAPIGSMNMLMTDTVPNGYLLAYGQAISRTTYGNLFSLYGTTFGVGDGSTTFNMPDMRGRFGLGQDDMGGSSANIVTDTRADTIGSGSGSETRTLLSGQIPSLSWNAGNENAGGGTAGQYLDVDGGGTLAVKSGNHDSAGNITVNSGGGSHNIMNPYLTVNFIIKY